MSRTPTIEEVAANIQRRLDPVAEARAIEATLAAEPTLTQQALGRRLGRTKGWVSKRLSLLRQPEDVRAAVTDGRITAEAAHRLIGLDHDTQREIVARWPRLTGVQASLEALQHARPQRMGRPRSRTAAEIERHRS